MPIQPKDPFSGSRPYQVKAREAFPYLVELAKSHTTRTYSDLARKILLRNPRNCDYVLGSVAEALALYRATIAPDVPHLTAVIVGTNSRLPGAGFMPVVFPDDWLNHQSEKERRKLVDLILAPVFSFSGWDDVLRHFELHPRPAPSIPLPSQPRGGEGEEHRELKLRIASHPQLAGLPRSMQSLVEEPLYSGDRVDIVFRSHSRLVAVEVKTASATTDELIRGLFQCVKYEAVLEAQRRLLQLTPKVEVRLVTGGSLTPYLAELAVTLGITVVQNAARSAAS